MAFLSITSMYLYKFIIPLIGISEATTEKLKLLQNIFLVPLPGHCNGQDLIAHYS